MIWKSKVRYWTLFCPKYCATSGAVPASTSAATAPAIRRMGIILSAQPAVLRVSGQHRSIAPQPLELIEGAQLGMEHMHYEIHVVEQHPATLRQPFHMMRRDAMRRQRRHQVLRHPPHVGVGRSRDDYEVVGGGAELSQVEYQRGGPLSVDDRPGLHIQGPPPPPRRHDRRAPGV